VRHKDSRGAHRTQRKPFTAFLYGGLLIFAPFLCAFA
jgi:hypothetical protein